MSIGWNFPSNNDGEIIGIGEAGIETFKGSLFSSLAREICQNSLDARLDYNKPVKVVFSLDEILRDEIPGIDELTSVMGLCKTFWHDNKKTEEFFSKAEKLCLEKTISVLSISDYNTTGLTGSDKQKSSPWQDLVKSSGVSNKTGFSGGSFGIGKSAPFACSDLRTVFYSTLDKDGLCAYQGVSKLVSFEKERNKIWSKKKEITQGKGYYGEVSNNTAVNGLITLNQKQSYRTDIGTDIYILGFIKDNQWQDKIITSILEGYLISIINKILEVQVNDSVINYNTVGQLLDLYKKEIPLTYNYYQVLTNPETTIVSEDFMGLGSLKLYVLIQKDFMRKFLMCRNNGMKIFDKQNISGTIPFAGICILEGEKLNSYFREMENPQHNKWEPDRHSHKTEARKYRQKLFSLLKEEVFKLGAQTVSDEMDAIGAGNFVPDFNVSDKNLDNSSEESITNKVKNFTLLEENEVILSTEVLNSNVKANEFQAITENIDKDPSEDKTLKIDNDSNNILEKEPSSDKFPKEKIVSIKPLKLRLFIFDSKKNIYKLSFVPNMSAKKSFIEIIAIGEQNNINISITSAIDTDRRLLVYNNNKVYIGDVKINEKISVFFTTKDKNPYSMEVVAYGYKI